MLQNSISHIHQLNGFKKVDRTKGFESDLEEYLKKKKNTTTKLRPDQ